MSKESMFKSVIVLTLVCVIAAALLGVTYSYTYDEINNQLEKALKESLKQVFPEADNFEQVENNSYSALKQDEVIGDVFVVESQGYSSMLKMLVGIDNQNNITAIRILEQAETPGLGANIEKPYFYKQFDGLKQDSVDLKSEGGEIDGITGATISSRAVIVGVKSVFGEENEQKIDEVTSATPEYNASNNTK